MHPYACCRFLGCLGFSGVKDRNGDCCTHLYACDTSKIYMTRLVSPTSPLLYTWGLYFLWPVARSTLVEKIFLNIFALRVPLFPVDHLCALHRFSYFFYRSQPVSPKRPSSVTSFTKSLIPLQNFKVKWLVESHECTLPELTCCGQLL